MGRVRGGEDLSDDQWPCIVAKHDTRQFRGMVTKHGKEPGSAFTLLIRTLTQLHPAGQRLVECEGRLRTRTASSPSQWVSVVIVHGVAGLGSEGYLCWCRRCSNKDGVTIYHVYTIIFQAFTTCLLFFFFFLRLSPYAP